MTADRFFHQPDPDRSEIPPVGPHMHRLWTDIEQTLRSMTGIHDESYTQWLKEQAAAEIGMLRAQVTALQAEVRSFDGLLDAYSCGCGDLCDPPVDYECENCKTATWAARMMKVDPQ